MAFAGTGHLFMIKRLTELESRSNVHQMDTVPPVHHDRLKPILSNTSYYSAIKEYSWK